MQPQQTPQTQSEAKLGGGFAGRTNKLADACYGFWSGAALAVRPFSLSIPSRNQILGANHLLDVHALGFGGIGKAPDEHPDPYHTYLSIAAAAITSPDPAWKLQPLDQLINVTHETARWAKSTFPLLRPASRNRSGRAGKPKKSV
ncbi:terpenoid cyclases/protein prenyltransferase alpha-alpha toroid [Lactifluus volemus]|nr:terpenoid cyclases/protein prenyltransferase alpha-alpha toroid [Lactifluus volemus]